jgi:predicted phage terminase large subunit-like protein
MDKFRSEIAKDVTRAAAKLLEKQEARAMEGNLMDFVRYVWPVVEPSIPMVEGWAVNAIADHLQAVTRGEIRRLLINVPPGFMKAITYETPVPTLGGWKPHGALRIGDYVFGPDGLPRVITNRTPNVLEPCYEITFDDGLKITAGAAHEWAIERDFPNQNHDGRGKWGRKPLIVETRDLFVGKGRQRSDRIPMSAPIQFPHADLEIEPYLLGYWLGDGDAGQAVIYCGKTDLSHVEILGREVVGTGTAHRVQIDDLKERLHYFDLVKNKHIPEEYFEGSVTQRWELVRGLMDSDGQADIDRDGQVRCRFTNENEKIIDGLHRILSSLGIKASRNGNRLRFTPPLGAKVFKLERKQSRLDARKIPPRASRIGYRYIKSVVPIGQKIVNCIEVDGGTYVAASHCFITRNSLLTNVFWPAWEWGPQNRPWYRYVCASYSNHLTERDNLRCRNVVMSERYQRLWRGRFRISNEQFTKVKFANDQTGWKLATSVGGIGVGERGDRFVIDDPNNTMMMESEAVRWTTNMWFTEVVPDRLNNPKESAIVVIQQRLHEEDVSGVALEQDLGYTHLCIPMEYIPNGMVCGYDVNGKVKNFDTWDKEILQPEKIFWVDPRFEDGELAWPQRFGPDECKEIKHAKKEYAWCNPGEAPVLMSDLSMKPISEVKQGDKLVGFTIGNKLRRARLQVAEVKSISVSQQPVVKMTFASGEVIRCTPNHKWWTVRNDVAHRPYAPARVGSLLSRVCPARLPEITDPEDIWDAAWLAGFFDGEGSVSINHRRTGNSSPLVSFTQGDGRNYDLCLNLERVLNKFGFNWGMVKKPSRGRDSLHDMRFYWLKMAKEGRASRLPLYQRFLHIVKPIKWKDRLTEASASGRLYTTAEKVVSIEPDGFETVYGLETTTGNYVVWGIASSNSGQYQQSPEIRGGSIIRRDYWQTWDAPQFPENVEYILASLDTAYTEKQENDASALTIWGMFRDVASNPKFILLHAWQERMELHALVGRVLRSCLGDIATGRPPVDRLLIESRAAGLSVSQEIRRLVGFNGQFGIELINPPSKNGDKVSRAHSILHLFADGMIYTPKGMTWCDEVINQCAVFPKGSHDDLVDSTTMALRYLRDIGIALTREEARSEIAELYRYRKPLGAIYPC